MEFLIQEVGRLSLAMLQEEQVQAQMAMTERGMVAEVVVQGSLAATQAEPQGEMVQRAS
jgi:hypothetical protein